MDVPAVHPNGPPDVEATVLICTYNRADDLDRTLTSLSRTKSRLSWDVIVVDNNSNDRTSTVVERHARDFPVRVHYLFEPRQGKSRALNAGIGRARAILIVFTDDDVVVPEGWLVD